MNKVIENGNGTTVIGAKSTLSKYQPPLRILCISQFFPSVRMY